MRKPFILALVMILSFAAARAADENTGKVLVSKGEVIESKSTAEQKPGRSGRSSYTMLLGSVSNIELADPSKITIAMKDERDGELHTVEITPTTSVTKVTDISELKAGDSIRIMAKKIDDKEVAVGIMFGNLKKLPAQKE